MFILSTVTYIAFAIYLYAPYFSSSTKAGYIYPIAMVAAATGTYLLSRRWVGSALGRFFAGALFGFAPLLLGLARYHVTATLMAAVIPFLFLPAAYCCKTKWRWLRLPLAALPFLAIVAFFKLSTGFFALFAVPLNPGVTLNDLAGLSVPLVAAKRGFVTLGLYHVPVAGLIVGLSIVVKARRFGVLAIIAAGILLALFKNLFEVSWLLWLIPPAMILAIVTAAGLQGLVWAGLPDRKWILAATFAMAGAAIVTLLLATRYLQSFAGLGSDYGRVFIRTAWMYILAAVATGAIYFIVRSRIRWHWFRWALLGTAVAGDIFFSAAFIVDKVH